MLNTPWDANHMCDNEDEVNDCSSCEVMQNSCSSRKVIPNSCSSCGVMQNIQQCIQQCHSVQSRNIQRYTMVKSYIQVFQTGLRFIYSFSAVLLGRRGPLRSEKSADKYPISLNKVVDKVSACFPFFFLL